LVTGLLFVSPWIVGLLAFNAYPLLSAFYYSLTNYTVLTPPTWAGLSNYSTLLHNSTFWLSLWNTIYYACVSLPLGLIVSFGLALLLNLRVRGLPIYRTIFYLPVVVPTVAVAELWQWLLDPLTGVVTRLLSVVGIHNATFFSSPVQAMPTLIGVGEWGVGGAVVIYLAGLQGISGQLYDAARIDGASWWAQVRYITIPLMTPVIFFNLIIGLIGALQNFNLPYLFTNGTGGVLNSLLTYVLLLYQTAFQQFQMGVASAMAVMLLGITVLIALLIFRSARGWVFYSE
jgi:multiple sugar transport system permease protein